MSYRIQVKHTAEQLWNWRILNDNGDVVDEANEWRPSRRSAIKAARRSLEYWERKQTEHWEDV